jgi:hypothetical protein
LADGAHQEKPISLFYSYSHRDEELRKKLEDHLAALRWSEKIAEWHDRNIDVGDEWAKEIDLNLTSADIILLLVSASFIASKYCWSVEMKKALERHDNGEAKVIPIILRPCAWQTTPFAKLQAAPEDAKPVTSWSDPDEALYNVARKIERAVTDLQQRRREQKQIEAERRAAEQKRPLPSNAGPNLSPLKLPDIALLGLMLVTLISLGATGIKTLATAPG